MRDDSYDKNIFYFEESDILPENESYVGRKMRLLNFRGWLDCDIEFPEDGCIVRNVAYGCYHYGNVKHPRDPEPLAYMGIGRTGTVRGRETCIIDGTDPRNVTFMFGDGKAVRHKVAREIVRGCFGDRNRKDPMQAEQLAGCRVGAKFVNRKGETAAITKVHSAKACGGHARCTVDVQFERDGKPVAVTGVSYHDLAAGRTECPTEEEERAAAVLEKVLPMSLVTKDGHLYEAEAVHGLRLDVMVDKVLVRDVPAEDYLRGTVKLGRSWRCGRSHIGDRATSIRGQELVVTAWRGARDIDVLVDGEPALHREMSNFNARRIISDRARKEMGRYLAESSKKKEEYRRRRAERMAGPG